MYLRLTINWLIIVVAVRVIEYPLAKSNADLPPDWSINMTEKYDSNGDYSAYNEDESNEYVGGGGGGKPRKSIGSSGGAHNGDSNVHDHRDRDHGGTEGSGNLQLNEKASEYIRDCMAEKNRMDRKFPIAEKLLEGGKCVSKFQFMWQIVKFSVLQRLKRCRQLDAFRRGNRSMQIYIGRSHCAYRSGFWCPYASIRRWFVARYSL